jgi:chloramphenicol-sensitive protein RarD
MFLHLTWDLNLLLVGSGLVTIVPLILFAAAAQRIPLSLVGILQYLAPTLQLLVGVFVYHETVGARLIGFMFVWMALLIFMIESMLQGRARLK